MRIFHCDHCGKLIFFENVVCGHCAHALAYIPDLKRLVSLDPTGGSDAHGPLYTTPVRQSEGRTYRLCANYTKHNVCNWGVASDDTNEFCISCRLTDTLETAAACGLSLQPGRADEPGMEKPPLTPADWQSFDEIIKSWFPLTYVLNSLNRGMGLADAYPFVLPPPAVEKLRFVHETICLGSKGES